MRLIAGKALDSSSPVPVYSDLFYFAGEFSEDGEFSYQLKENQEAGFYIVNGVVEGDGESFERFKMVTFKKGSKITLKASKGTQFMFFGGEVFPEGRTIFWNFVSSDPEKIEKAKDDWKNKRFPEVINETEFIPLPE